MTQGKILVTGSTGAIGSYIVHQLLYRKVNFRAAYHDAANLSKVNLPGVEVVQIDYDRLETIRTSLAGVEKLFLLTPDLYEYEVVNIISTFVDEARKAGVKKIVDMSVMGADAGFKTITGTRYRDAETVIEASGISYTHLRPNYFMQNFVNFYAQNIREHDAFYLPLDDAKISFVDIQDVASVAVESLVNDGHCGKAFTITGPESLSCYETAQILSEVTERKIDYVSISENETRKRLGETNMPLNVVEYLIYSYKFTREGNFSLITDTVEQVTGKRPISFKQFAAQNKQTFINGNRP
jgi:uncharacterized protein YbjT (DUF2867 family)